ncbi:Exonuclease mut-7 [Linnemannia gamsii]|uniref:Exonuclease mut-7 n=1 Tax=Linnemannia gamsii TaxID=64522 RepID=A0ABQ7KEI2_9FUNG|nr:Exonuclease mut-7 [Linnemannia gamsii]
MYQLKQLYDSLFNSDVVGISLIRPLAKPWAKTKHLHPDELQQQQQLMLQQREEVTMRMKKSGKSDGGSGGQCTYLQLACSSDKHVYVVDLEVFLDEEIDPSHKFPRLIGEIFFNPSICKLAYNWSEEARSLKTLFPALRESQYRMDNLIDLFYIWIVPNPNFKPKPQTSYSSHNLPVTTTNASKKIKAWYCGSGGEKKPPYLPTTMLQPRYRNVSGLLVRVMGKFLRRTSRLGWDAWTVRPLSVCLQTDLAMSAQCLVDLFAVLDKEGQRKEREETVEFKVQATTK